MRESLTILGLVLVALLSVALAAPYFINWSAHRDVFEAQIGRVLGQKVALTGPIDLKLLPIPSLQLGAIKIESAPGQALFAARGVEVKLAIMPLLQGRFEFIEAVLDHPKLRLLQNDDGTIIWPNLGSGKTRDIVIQHLVFKSGDVTLTGDSSKKKLVIEGLDLDAHAASLRGPYEGTGQMATAQGPLAFHFATGEQSPDGLPIKVEAIATGALPKMAFVGRLISAALVPPRFEGTVKLDAALPAKDNRAVPWQIAGSLSANLTKAVFDKLTARLGTEVTGLMAQGKGEILFGAAPHLSLSLTAPQIDIDRLQHPRRADGDPQSGSNFDLSRALDDLDLAGHLPFGLDLAIDSPLVTFGGDALTDFSAHIASDDKPGIHVVLTTATPGASQLALDGTLETGAAANYFGSLRATTKDAPRLARWLSGLGADPAALAVTLQAMPFQQLSWQGQTRLSPVSLTGSDITVQLDRSTLRGALTYTGAVGHERPRLFADFTSQTLDLDNAPNLGGLIGGRPNLDLSLQLDAKAVRLARFGAGMMDAGRIRLRLSRLDGATRLERLDLENVGGANIDAAGTWSANAGTMKAHIDAAGLKDVSQLLRQIMPGAWTDALSQRSTALSPAKIDIAAEGVKAEDTSSLRLTRLSLNGTVADTTIAASLQPTLVDPQMGAGHLQLNAPQAGNLLRQLGFDALPLVGLGTGQLDVTASGALGNALSTRMSAEMAGTKFTFDGTFDPNLAAPKAHGAFNIITDNGLPLSEILAMALPENSDLLPINLGGQLAGTIQEAQLSQLHGVIDGTTFDGDIALGHASAQTRQLNGALHLKSLALPALLGLALGSPQPASRSALWSSLPFAAGFIPPIETHLRLAIDQFDMGKLAMGKLAMVPAPATLKLDLANGAVALDDLHVKLGEGQAAGRLLLRRDAKMASMSGSLRFDDIGLRLPSLAAKGAGNLEFASTGANPAALVANMAGKGAITLANQSVPKASAGAIASILSAVDSGNLSVEGPKIDLALARQLDQAANALPDATYLLGIAAGQLRLGPAKPDTRLALTLNLANLELDQQLQLHLTTPPTEWTGALPSIGVAYQGPLLDPRRHIDAARLTDDLELREIARQTARIAAFQADVQERAAFMRRLHGLRSLKQADEDEQAWRAEQARLAAIANAARDAAAAAAAKAASAEALRLKNETQALEDAQKILQSGIMPSAPVLDAPLLLGRPKVRQPVLPKLPILSPLVPDPLATQ